MFPLGFAQTPRPDEPPLEPPPAAAPEASPEPNPQTRRDRPDASDALNPESFEDADAAEDYNDPDPPDDAAFDPDAPETTAPPAGDPGRNPDDDATPEDRALAAESAALHRHTVADEVGDTLSRLLPWGVSLLAHAGLVLIAIFIVWSVQQVADDEEVIIPLVNLSETPGVPLQTVVQERVETTTTAQQTPSPSPSDANSPTAAEVSVAVALPGLGEPIGGAPSFSVDVGDAAAFETNFIGSGGNARNIVFVIDASGSLVDTMPFVVDELKQTIRGLDEKQRFGVVFTREGIREQPLSKADSEQKTRVLSWLEDNKYSFARGNDDVVAALRTALQMKPDLIFLLSDNITGVGEYSIDRQKLLDEINRANTKNTKINTIQFLYPDPLERVGGRATLDIIARNTGGIYTFMDARTLGLE